MHIKSILGLIGPFRFLNLCNIILYQIVPLFWHEKHIKIYLVINHVLNT
jgi:hypothetical protein